MIKISNYAIVGMGVSDMFCFLTLMNEDLNILLIIFRLTQ